MFYENTRISIMHVSVVVFIYKKKRWNIVRNFNARWHFDRLKRVHKLRPLRARLTRSLKRLPFLGDAKQLEPVSAP